MTDAVWWKSSFSDGGQQCVEVADVRGTHRGIAVRDSKHPAGPALLFDADQFTRFTQFAAGFGA
ncbi:DUF397 domain-containing protein [Streptomyces sp. N2-109]|uniref:DUF397 domain-containing protein n=1 Tax=Streptomyces gossypii TaxID=2883101 RepID=A0ABT2JZZ3_9ACTN|nr:DUF397 domain-containing protein [Streptomyces gossypii]MCT2593431.1 DUF397 domain-containing protein [Streptomyces gossypii]